MKKQAAILLAIVLVTAAIAEEFRRKHKNIKINYI